MTSASSRLSTILRAAHRQLGFLAIVFACSTLMFTFSRNRIKFILWTETPSTAIVLVVVAGLLGLGWAMGRRLARLESGGNVARPGEERKHGFRDSPYNIFGTMEPRLRRQLALAVFFTFSIIGPLGLLMGSMKGPIPFLTFVIVTFSSGAMSASFVLFGHRKILLVGSFAFWLLVNANAAWMVDDLEGVPPPTAQSTDKAELLREAGDERVLFGTSGIILIAVGYVLWIVVVSKEGARRRQYQMEVEVAQKIQQRLIPAGSFNTNWFEAAGTMVAASDVGGDYFDFISIDPERAAFVVADVAGHGIGPGIVTAMLKSALRSQVMHDPLPVPVLENLNATIHQVADRNMFVTLAYVLLDNSRAMARIATAGHPPVCLVKKDGTLEEIRSHSLGLGMRADGHFTEEMRSLQRGDRIYLYTDGVIEAADKAGTQFDVARLHSALRENDGAAATESTQNVINAVRRFMANGEFRDDVTVVCVRFLSSQT